MMRTDRRYTRTRTMLSDELPLRDDGGFDACHHCQRDAYFAGGFLALLARDLSREATFRPPPSPGDCPRCGSDYTRPLGGKAGKHGLSKCYSCRKQFTARTDTERRASKLPDEVWNRADALFSAGRSTASVARELGITQRSSWLLEKRLIAARASKATQP